MMYDDDFKNIKSCCWFVLPFTLWF